MAVTGGCNNCVKYLLFLFNFVFLCFGVGIVAVGLWLRFDHQNDIYVQEIQDHDRRAVDYYFIGTYVTMATGCVIMAVGFLGCCGAMQESICMLVFYFIALLTIFGLEIAGCTWCYVNREEIGVMFSDELSKIIKEKYKENDIAAQKGVDLLQEKLKCCGIDSYMDWFDSGQMIPDSCSCNTTEDKSGCSDRGFYLNGCGKEIEEDVLTNIFILAGIGVGISFIEILGMLFSVVLCCAIFKSYDPEDEEYRYMAAIRPFARRKPEQKQSTPHETSFGIGIFRD